LKTDNIQESHVLGYGGVLKHYCACCYAAKSSFSRCAGCRVVRYCSKEQQVLRREDHKKVCKKVKKLRADVATEEEAVRNAEEDFMTPANALCD
jgi:hypothetical protein